MDELGVPPFMEASMFAKANLHHLHLLQKIIGWMGAAAATAATVGCYRGKRNSTYCSTMMYAYQCGPVIHNIYIYIILYMCVCICDNNVYKLCCFISCVVVI